MPGPPQPAKVEPDTETVSVPVEPCVERQEPAEPRVELLRVRLVVPVPLEATSMPLELRSKRA
ncbi:MAG: hypothetical protein MUC96_17050 [Myxococcaceae bacterium]|nr:hypothetical protein [Myxococcaceae bacterium]